MSQMYLNVVKSEHEKVMFVFFCNLGAGHSREQIRQFSPNLAGCVFLPVECNDVVFEAIQVKHRSLNESQTGKKVLSFMFACCHGKSTPPQTFVKRRSLHSTMSPVLQQNFRLNRTAFEGD